MSALRTRAPVRSWKVVPLVYLESDRSIHTVLEIEERDFAYIDEVSFLRLIVDVLTCFLELFTKSRASSGSYSLILCKGRARSTFRADLHPLVRMSHWVYLGIANPALEKGSKSAFQEHKFHVPADPCKHEQSPGIASQVPLTQIQKRESEKYHNVG